VHPVLVLRSAQAALRSEAALRRAESEPRWAQHSKLVRVASRRERRARPAVHSVHAGLHRAVLAQERAQARPLVPAAERAAAELRHDAAAGSARRQAAPAVRADELAMARRDAAAARHEAAPEVPRGVRQEPAVQPADAAVLPLAVAEAQPSVLAEVRLSEVQAVRPSVAQEALPSAQHAAAVPSEAPLAAACAPAPFAVRPAPSSERLARRGQIAKWKMRRSRARPVSDFSCPSLVLAP
jgi:hypothetical protein